MKTNTALARKIARAASAGSKPAMRGDVGNRPAVARRGDTTRLAILNAAERCFGEAGFDGVSLRTITEVAGVDLALVNYHFGSKDNLLREVIARRARVVHDDRVRALEAARHDAGVRSPSIEAIVTAFLEPLLRRLNGGDRGWRYYGGLVSQLDVLPQFIGLTEVLDPTALHFINALRVALPQGAFAINLLGLHVFARRHGPGHVGDRAHRKAFPRALPIERCRRRATRADPVRQRRAAGPAAEPGS